MFKALLRTRIAALGSWLFMRNRSQQKKKMSKLKIVGFAALMLYACFAFMMMFGIYFEQLAKPFFGLGIGWLYFTFFAMSAFALMFIGSVFMAKSQLYEATDNDLLLSMPIPPKFILASRLIMLMLMNFVLELIVAVPAFVMWVRAAELSAVQVLAFVLIVLALPFFSMAISGLFGWLLALTTSRLRKKSLMTVIFSVLFLLAYFALFSQANTYIQKLIQNGTEIAGSLGSVAPLYWIGNAVAQPNTLQLVLSLLIMLVPFVLMYYVLSATFIKVTTSKRGIAKVKYEARQMHTASPSKALFRREMKRLLSSPVYLLNAGLGVLFCVILAGGLIIKKATVLNIVAQLGFSGDMLYAIVVFALCLMSTTVLFTAPSVSLEGKTIWIVKSLPVSETEILKAKLHLHIYLTAPAVFLASAAAIYVLAPSLTASIIMLVAPVLFVLLSANIGLICNLKNPNLDWVNETQVVKQSMSVLIAMLLSSVTVIVPGVLFFVISTNMEVFLPFMSGFTVFLILGWRLTYSWIMTKGAKTFAELG